MFRICFFAMFGSSLDRRPDIDSETDEYVNEDNDYPNYLKQRDYQPETRKQEPPFLGSKDPNETDSSTEESEETIPPSTREENEKRCRLFS